MVKTGAILDRCKTWLIGKPGVTYQAKTYTFEFWKIVGGVKKVTGKLMFGYLDSVEDRQKYQGTEFNYIGFDKICRSLKTI